MATDKDSKANRLRAALKAAGYNARRVSVRHDHYSMGSSIYVTIRDASVSLAAVEAIASSYERIDRCAYSGEILSGGNTYLRVEYDRKVTEPLEAEIRTMLDATEPGVSIELETGVRAARDLPGSRWNSAGVLFLGTGDDERQIHCHDTASVAHRGVVEVLEARARIALAAGHGPEADSLKRAARQSFLETHGRYPTNSEMARLHADALAPKSPAAVLVAAVASVAVQLAAPAPAAAEPVSVHLAMLAAMGVES